MATAAPTGDERIDTGGAGSVPAGRAAASGLLAAAAGIGVAELVGGLVDRVPSLVLSVGDAVIDSVPGWLERAAIAALGSNDKPVLLASIALVAAGLGAATGLLARYRFLIGAVAFVLVTAVGVAAGLATEDVSPLGTVLAGLLGAAVGVAVLHRLLAAAAREARPDASPGTGRRGFLLLAAGAAAVAVAGGVGGWLLTGRERLDAVRAAIRLPRPARPAPAPLAGADLDIPGLTPLYVANEDFYRIDTALRVPTVDPADWRLEITGLVDQPFSLTYDELMAMPQIEADVTLACVSNEVGGDLVGNARWQGVPLRALLERAGVQRGATQLLSRSVDGFTAGFPTVTALDLEEAMVAVGMNGEPLPAEHGFPARLVVPGLYGYVSATKWLSSIELTDWDVDGYWVPRGWAKEGPIKTQSRIDVPRPGGSVSAGRQPIAGVAWAPTRGIEGVEVRIDDGPWQPAVLAEQLDVDCWRQWYLPWDATPGRHVITARATDGAGERQTDERTPVAPDGASGHPAIEVDVDG
ncbi:sulfite oxidase [uncultured Modestobacter sp.]|uniref:sulfite oxidase n=1 Tax=uncultured Modestobacter sp. TaxID=380048 RepID=UPI00260AAA05|nr:sulfite oxidase [uncultured Modestobacter sp.]